jgi:hypothetical protein
MFKMTLAVAAATLTLGALTSQAEAKGSGNFYASPFFRNQGRPQQTQPDTQYDSEQAYKAKQRAQAAAAARARAAAAAAAAASQAQQARILAEKQKAAKANETAAVQTPPAAQTAPADQTSDKLDGRVGESSVAKTDSAPANTVENANLATPPSTANSDSEPAAPQTCRKYSAATGGLVDTPCE